MAQFSVNSYSVEQIINWIRSKEIAIPEIQRPFVWDGKKVRDLIDSLYKGFPIGYIVTWKNPNIKLKDGTISQGKKIFLTGGNFIIVAVFNKEGKIRTQSLKEDIEGNANKFVLDIKSAISADSEW